MLSFWATFPKKRICLGLQKVAKNCGILPYLVPLKDTQSFWREKNRFQPDFRFRREDYPVEMPEKTCRLGADHRYRETKPEDSFINFINRPMM